MYPKILNATIRSFYSLMLVVGLFIISSGIVQAMILSSPSVSSVYPSIQVLSLMLPINGQIIQGFSSRHYAIDITAPSGTPILAAANGTIIEVHRDGEWHGGYGNMVIIDHGNGIKTLYAHLDSVDVQLGDYINQGGKLGIIGTTGRVFNANRQLHWELRNQDLRVNPTPYVNTEFHEGIYYETAIEWMKQNQIANGYPDGTFGSEICVNRVELLKMLFETLEVDIYSYEADLFSDTLENQWYTQYVIAGRARETINGYPDKTFKPAQCVNRIEAIKMAILEFNDGEIPDQWGTFDNPYDIAKTTNNPWWKPYFVSAMAANSVGTSHFTRFDANWSEMGIDNDFANPTYNFGPGESMTRKELAEMLYRMKAMQDNDVEYYDGNIKPTD